MKRELAKLQKDFSDTFRKLEKVVISSKAYTDKSAERLRKALDANAKACKKLNDYLEIRA